MYRPSAFMTDDPDDGFSLIARYPLAQLIVVDDTGTAVATPVPLLVDVESGCLIGHLARTNPCSATPGARSALVIFSGADAYISPDFYPSKVTNPGVVPTWNYETVQIRGVLTVRDDTAWTERVVRRLTEHFEAGRTTPWHVDDAPDDFIERMVRGIVGLEITIDDMVTKRKLSQNRNAIDQEGTSLRLAAGSPRDVAVADAMRCDGEAQ